MDRSLRIQEFHALLNSDNDDSEMLTALRQLRTLERPEEITKLGAQPMQAWGGWTAN